MKTKLKNFPSGNRQLAGQGFAYLAVVGIAALFLPAKPVHAELMIRKVGTTVTSDTGKYGYDLDVDGNNDFIFVVSGEKGHQTATILGGASSFVYTDEAGFVFELDSSKPFDGSVVSFPGQHSKASAMERAEAPAAKEATKMMVEETMKEPAAAKVAKAVPVSKAMMVEETMKEPAAAKVAKAVPVSKTMMVEESTKASAASKEAKSREADAEKRKQLAERDRLAKTQKLGEWRTKGTLYADSSPSSGFLTHVGDSGFIGLGLQKTVGKELVNYYGWLEIERGSIILHQAGIQNSSGAPVAFATNPEPSTVLVLLLSSLGLIGRRRRRALVLSE